MPENKHASSFPPINSVNSGTNNSKPQLQLNTALITLTPVIPPVPTNRSVTASVSMPTVHPSAHNTVAPLLNRRRASTPTIPVIFSASASSSVRAPIPITVTSSDVNNTQIISPYSEASVPPPPAPILPFIPANNKVSIPSHVATTNSSITALPKTQLSRVIMGINSPTSTPPSIPVQNMASISSSTLASNGKITSSSASLLMNTLKSLSQYASTSQTLPISSLNPSYKTALTILASTTIDPQNTSSPERINSLLLPLPQPPVVPAPFKMTKGNDPSFELMSGYLSSKFTSLRRSSSVVPPILPAKCQTQDFKRSKSLPVIKKLKVNKCKTDLVAAISFDDKKSQIEEDEPRGRTLMTNHSGRLQQKRNLSPQSFKGMSEQQTFFSFLRKQLRLTNDYDEIEEDQGVSPDHLISASNRLMKKFSHTLGELYIQTEDSLKKKKARKINEFLYVSARNIHFQDKLSSKFEFDPKCSGSKKTDLTTHSRLLTGALEEHLFQECLTFPKSHKRRQLHSTPTKIRALPERSDQ